ncbi:hypothetical protein NC651_003223 [Populus alba x Populus x berolinensis]|nr:hypothetical protein NC651_003223 [Populus alba x Populus x berolinensis]
MTEKPIIRKCCNNQLWLVILISFVLCFVLLCFDYSALTGNQDGVTAVLVGNYENSITTQKSESLQFTTGLNETLIRQPSKDQQSVKEKPVADSCSGEYIYIHDLPRRFNQELIESCESITVGTERNMCPYLVNSGLGHEVENFEGVLLNKSWYSTNQFLLAVIFHNKMKQYKCLTNDSSLASAIYVPFYAGLDVGRYLWGVEASIRDQSSFDFVKWMVSQPEWKKMWGRDHFMVVGRISWDFRRKTDNESDWGSKLRFLPESNNMSMLSIESSSWNNDYAIPYPTCFHPSKDSEVLQWQDKMRRQKRPYLFSFAGAPRSDLQDSVRGKIIEECQASKNLCKLLECSYGVNGAITCDNPANVMRLFQNSVYCLQPAGDSYTRRSIFDAILAGCIPVFFHPGTAYAQYKWHLPQNYSKYSVFIPVKDVKDWKAGINETLLRIPEERVMSMREEVIRLIPSIIYADPRSRLETFEDAFDLAVKGILDRIDGVRKVIRDGGDPSAACKSKTINPNTSTFPVSATAASGFFDSSTEPPLPPPPPPVEVLSSEVSLIVKCSVEPVNLEDGLTLLKGRVSTKEVFGLPNSDLVPGVYEGGLKLWEGSLDLIKALQAEVRNGHLSFSGKRVLELGCGHGLPGIFAFLEGASAVHFQDFNAEVLRCLTIPNVNANLSEKLSPSTSEDASSDTEGELRFFAGDWSQVHQCLPHANKKEKDLSCSSGRSPHSGYDIVLMAETIYSISAQHNLYGLIKKCLSHPGGVVYMAAKKHYFGVGGGTRQFLSMVEKDGAMAASLVAEVADGSSNVREVWKLSI